LGEIMITEEQWEIILESLKAARIKAGSMAEEKVSGFVDIPMQDRLEKPYKKLIQKIKKRLDK